MTPETSSRPRRARALFYGQPVPSQASSLPARRPLGEPVIAAAADLFASELQVLQLSPVEYVVQLDPVLLRSVVQSFQQTLPCSFTNNRWGNQCMQIDLSCFDLSVLLRINYYQQQRIRFILSLEAFFCSSFDQSIL